MNRVHFFSSRLNRLRLGKGGHHQFGHAEKPSGQRERPDAAREQGLVAEGFGDDAVGLEVLRDAAGFERRDFQCLDLRKVVYQSVGNARNFVFGKDDVCAEGLRLYRQIHDDRACVGGVAVIEGQNGAGVHFAVGDGVAYRITAQFDARMGHDRNRQTTPAVSG